MANVAAALPTDPSIHVYRVDRDGLRLIWWAEGDVAAQATLYPCLSASTATQEPPQSTLYSPGWTMIGTPRGESPQSTTLYAGMGTNVHGDLQLIFRV